MRKNTFRLCTAITSTLILASAGAAHAQDRSGGLSEIIVTAQKREQSLQDVPIAVSALAGETLQANRITTVNDLSGLAPGLTTSGVAGAGKNVQVSMRGNTTNGVVPGADRAVGIYIDGVYIGGSKGSIFDLPEISRIEVLRGPQGTLFGRNSTSGAISITTRNPTGELGGKVYATIGNRDQRRLGLGIDLPQIGPFSGYVSYLHSERRGDLRNTAAGMRWDRTNSAVRRIAKIQTSPKWLGSENTESVFGALKFESGDFTTVYKFDLLRSENTPQGTAPMGYAAGAPGVGPFFTALFNSQAFAVPFAVNGKRPDAVANGYAVPGFQRGVGHSVTSTYQVNDNLSIKNIFAVRKAQVFGTSSLDGVSALLLTPSSAPLLGFPSFLVGTPFAGVATQPQSRSSQTSDELQLTYQSDLLTATVGGLWYNGKDHTNEYKQVVTASFSILPGGVIPNSAYGVTFNEITSLAGYAQFEIHATDQLDIIVGGRLTSDKKDGSLDYKVAAGAPTLLVAPTYKKSKFTYSVGANYKPDNDTLAYAKYSTGFTSGGSTGGITYRPESVKSWEAGLKTALFDNRLQANLAVYLAKYKDIQGATSFVIAGMTDYVTQLTGDPTRAATVNTFVVNNGDLKAKGFELEVTTAPVSGLTMGGSLGYTDAKFRNVNALVRAANQGRYGQILLPDWTATVWGQYNTPPIGFGDAFASIRFDMRWQSDMPLNANPQRAEVKTFLPYNGFVPAYAVVNGRVAIEDIDLGGVKAEIAAWGKNLSDNRSANYALILGPIGGANFIPARTYGMDLTVRF